MGAHKFSQAGYALILGAALALPQTAFAFESTNNPVADVFLTSLEAGDAKNVAVENVAVSGNQIVLNNLTVDYESDGDTGNVTIGNLAFSDATVATDGSISAAALALTDANLVDDEDTIEFAAAVVTDVRIPSPAEIENPSKALNVKPAYKSLEITGITLKAEDEVDVPIERISSTFETMGTDGSAKASFAIEKFTLDPAGVDDEDFGKTLADLGYDALQLDVKAKGEWSAADGRLNLEDFQISGQDMGALHLSATILGVTPDFIGKLDTAQENFGKLMELLQSLSISDIRIHFKNDTVVERVLDCQAKEVGTDRAGLVDQLSSSLPGILSLLGNPGFQEKVAKAATTFLKEPGTLTASTHPAQPVPVAQVVGTAMIAPQTIPDVLSVEVTANQ
ncbi:hypothetical protein [Breoghania sp.]|uniref:hypothetical protein n=1 Tax=Breoghania sp. TaxID=2065378 RepID=UPI002636C3FC|nr:hypothetical protein [Breoghania sp.]MDJ0930812.1 hypothetical protein [Breoghania sp.]